MRRLPILVPLFVSFVVLAGCGGGGASSVEVPRTSCRANALQGDVGLPGDFPRPAELTITNSKRQGPTLVVDGYWESGLEEAYRDFKKAVEDAGYDVTFDEIEDHDAEVAYKGSGRSGLIALRDTCTEDSVMRVRITNRPE